MKRLPTTVIILAITSFFTDVGTEMIFPLLPAFLLTLGAGPAFLGIIEGAADTVASLLKLVSGQIADRLERKKPVVLAGYTLASLVRPLVALATAPWHVLMVRVIDRVGKGVRSSPRDALIADATTPEQSGRAFGFHRALDHAGAVTGPLVASALIYAGLELKELFLWAAVPGVLAIILVASIREEPKPIAPVPAGAAFSLRGLPKPLQGYLGVFALFCLANSSDAFLLLRAHELGVPAAVVPLLWSAHHVSKVLGALVGGRLADRIPRTRVIVAGWIVYGLSYMGLAIATGPGAAWVLFIVYGLYHGLAEPAEKALVRDLAPPERRGASFGAYNFIAGIAALPAGLAMGLAWKQLGSSAALSIAGAIALVSALLLVGWERRRTSQTA